MGKFLTSFFHRQFSRHKVKNSIFTHFWSFFNVILCYFKDRTLFLGFSNTTFSVKIPKIQDLKKIVAVCDSPHFLRERWGVDIPPKILKIRWDKKLILRGENGNLKIFFAKRENFFQKIVLFSDFYLIKIEKAKISHFFRIWRIPPNQIFHAQTKQNLATLAEFRHFWSHCSWWNKLAQNFCLHFENWKVWNWTENF